MKKQVAVFVVLGAFILGATLNAADYQPGEIIVKFKASSQFANVADAEQGVVRPYVVAVDDTEAAISEMSERGDVEYAEPNYIISADEVPNDWAYDTDDEWTDLSMPEAWEYFTALSSTSDVVVAIVDSGVDLDHPELVDALVSGYDFANGDSEPEDDSGHGTKVSGIIAAKGNNGSGIAGVAWDAPVQIMPLKFMKKTSSGTTGNTSDAVSAIYYAVDNGAKVINASWGMSTVSTALEEAIAYARDQGVLFVCSAGNDSQDNDVYPHYPSNYQLENLIAVAAMNRYDGLASFSNYGENSVHVAAPGVGLESTDLDGDIDTYISGTSFAAPFVSAIAAMVYSSDLSLSVTQVRTRVLEGSIMDSDYDEELLAVGGCVNAYNALAGVSLHEAKSATGWTAPAAETEEGSESSGEGGGGGGCFIATATTGGGLSGILIITATLFLAAVPPRRQE